MLTVATIAEMELKIGCVELVQIGRTDVVAQYDFSPGCKEEPATVGDPGSPGDAPQCELSSVTLTTQMVFAESAVGDVPYLTLAAGSEIFDILQSSSVGRGKIEGIEEEIISQKQEEFA